MKTLHSIYQGIPGRTGANLPVAVVHDAIAMQYFDGAAWTPDLAKAKRYPLAPMPTTEPGRYVLNLAGNWSLVGLRVLVYDLATDPFPQPQPGELTMVRDDAPPAASAASYEATTTMTLVPKATPATP